MKIDKFWKQLWFSTAIISQFGVLWIFFNLVFITDEVIIIEPILPIRIFEFSAVLYGFLVSAFFMLNKEIK